MRSNDSQGEPGGLAQIFRALRYRNYRLFFGGQSVSLIGTWMQSIAMSWLVYQLTHSAFLLGLVGFAGQIATFILSPFAGIFIDRWPRRNILVVTQSLAMIQAFILAFLTLSGLIQVWHIISLSVFLGFVNGFDMSTRQAFVIEIVENRDNLPNAIALNSATFNLARLIGPSIAGLVIATLGEAACFFLNGISYIAVIIALLAMQMPPVSIIRLERTTGALPQFLEGLRYVLQLSPVRDLLLMLALISFAGTPYTVLMPVFAKVVLGGGAHTLGFLMAAIGVGALIGAVYLAAKKSVVGLGRWVALAAIIFGVGMIAFALSRVLWLSLLVLAITGFGMMVQMASSNTLLQTIIEDEKRGRVMSFYTMAFAGMTPFGSLLAGVLASRIGAPLTVAISGVFCIIGGFVFCRRLPELRRIIHPIYIEKGILPEIAYGVQIVTEERQPPED